MCGDADARDLQACGVAGCEHLGLIHGTRGFDARETGIAEQLEFFAEAEFSRRLAIERREHEALGVFAGRFRRGGSGRRAGRRRLGGQRRGERHGGGERGGGAEKRAAIHGWRRGRTRTKPEQSGCRPRKEQKSLFMFTQLDHEHLPRAVGRDAGCDERITGAVPARCVRCRRRRARRRRRSNRGRLGRRSRAGGAPCGRS